MNEWEEYFNKFMAELKEEIAYEPKAAPATQPTPVCTEILSEEAINYIDATRKAAYDQGYTEGYERGIEDLKAKIRKRIGLD